MASQPAAPTPSSEIIHLVSTFGDTLDSLPPTLTRSLSDLKELDAVLSGSLKGITTKLQLLHSMISTPPPGSPEAESAPKYTPFERLKLLREVTEDARVFRLGGEDKIRVATSTCETIATHTSHLATLSSLLLTFLPAHLLPLLPPPAAPHGYPSSSTSGSALARRQQFDYPPSRHAGAGSTARMQGALGMVREHWDMTRGTGAGGRPSQGQQKKRSGGILGGGSAGAMDMLAGGGNKGKEEKDPLMRHPNQYTKKRMQQAQMQQQGGSMSGGMGGAVPATQHNAAAGLYASPYAAQHSQHGQHPMGMTAIDAVKVRKGAGSVVVDVGRQAGGIGQGQGMMYQGMATQEEYNAATGGPMGMGRASGSKRKMEEGNGARKKTKKGPDSPDITPRALPQPFGTSLKHVPRRTNSQQEAPSPEPLPPMLDDLDGELDVGEEGDEGDKTIYCFCQRVSFGEMIGCDGGECEREWFHLSCVGLSAIPKGRWFCDDCRRQNEKAGKKRR